jgi:hypothetical protein
MLLQRSNGERITGVNSKNEIQEGNPPPHLLSKHRVEYGAKQSRFVLHKGIAATHCCIALLISSMIYLHTMEPITSKFLTIYGCEVIRPTDPFANLYIAEAKFWLRVSYSCTIVGAFQLAILLTYRRVESVFQGLLLAGLVFLQISGYLQREWLLHSYNVLTFGV